MKKIVISAIVLAISLSIFSLTGCNQLAKKFGGTVTEKLKPGEKMVNVSWKGDELWFVTRPMRQGEIPETYTYRESSNFGVIEGTVIIVEQAK